MIRTNLLLWLALLCLLGGPSPAAPAKPNVLFILVDDFGWGDLAANGRAGVPTPRMDQLAINEDGVLGREEFFTSGGKSK